VVVFTIGHSTRSLDELVAALRAHGVEQLVDVRTVPRSARNPQFARERLARDLPARGIAYVHLAALGGLRGRTPGVAPEVNAAWENASFHRYADWACTDGFARGLDELVRLAALRPTAIMCAEAVWWRCHRRIIADHLLARGIEVRHVATERRATAAAPTPFARFAPDGSVTYPARAETKSERARE
jgi:uncharacterized protein (DUF488 family)